MELHVKSSKAVIYFRGVLVSAALLSLAILLGIHAQAAPPTGASGLSISPLRQELTLKPGQADKVDITLKNITGTSIIAQVKLRDFTSDNVSGTPKIITDPNVHSPYSIRSFLIGPEDVPLSIGEQKKINIPVQVPDGTTPGAYYGLVEYKAVAAQNSNSTGNNKVALSAAVSQLVFITVPGNVSDRMQLNAIHVYHNKDGTSEGLFFTSPPKSAGVDMSNIGNGFTRPFGNVSVQNTASKQVYSYELNGGIVRSIVLPNSTRIFKSDLKNITKPGRYTIVTNLSYGPGSAILTGKKTFWYIPAWIIIVVIIILLILIAVVWLARRRYKRATFRRHRN